MKTKVPVACLLSLVAILAFTATTLAQSEIVDELRKWQRQREGDKVSRTPKRDEDVRPALIRWQADQPDTDHFTVDGQSVKIITVDGLTISLSLSEERLGGGVYYDKFVVYLYAINQSERRIEFSPDMVTVEAVKPKARHLKRETVAHLVNSIKWRAAIAGALGEFGASMQTAQSNTTGAVYGPDGTATYTATTTSPDVEARRRASQQSATLNSSAARAGLDLERIELKTNTLLSHGEVRGMLIFDRQKNCEEALVRIAVDGKVVEFPFVWQRKKR